MSDTKRFSIATDVSVPERFTDDEVVELIALGIQAKLVTEGILTTKVEVTVGKFKPGTSGSPTPAGGKPGRKPINRPKVESWIRANVQAGDSGIGQGLGGVDREGNVQTLPNRVFIGKLAMPETMGGVGLSLIAIDKVMKELETEGFVERGFAAGSPFFDYIRELHPEGYSPGVEIKRASIHEVDFTYAHGPEPKASGTIITAKEAARG